MDPELEEAVVVEFPLRGERWVAVTTPGDRIPSHGVNMLGQRYAYDLLKVDERKGVHYYPASSLSGVVDRLSDARVLRLGSGHLLAL